MKTVFVNFTNHPSSRWEESQLEAARRYGDIIDLPFPAVNPDASEEDVARLADECLARILEYEASVVLVQGEFTLVYAVVSRLKAEGIRAVAACSVRDVREQAAENGAPAKTVVFHFRRFREYV